MRFNLYAQNQHVVAIDGIPLSGFNEGDFLSVKVDGNAATRTRGADGPAMNLAQAQGGTITVSLLPTSPAIGVLLGMRDAQLSAPRMFSIQVLTGVNEVVRAEGCAFADLPQFQTGGPTMQPRQFAFECMKISLDTSLTEAISGGLISAV